MKNIGKTGSVLELFTSYLSEKKLLVKIYKTYYNDETNIKCGIPRGTMISPIFFNIQLHDIKNLHLKSTLASYSDDT